MAGKKKKGTKKKKSGGGGKKKKGRKRSTPKKHLGATLGTAYTGYKVATEISPIYSMETYKALVQSVLDGKFDRTKAIIEFSWDTTKKNATPLIAGLAVSYGEDVPVVGELYKDIVKKPMDRLLGKLERKLTKKKARWKW